MNEQSFEECEERDWKFRHIISYLKSKDNAMPSIGVGGIDSKEEADKKMALGCDLIQIYSGFIYKGPRLIEELTR